MPERVYGLDVQEIPDGATPIEALVVLKALDENGHVCLYRRATDGLVPWETVGILQVLLDAAREDAQLGYDWDERQEALDELEDE